jgi:diguanylate cyclase (GGDEF)-like protein
MARQLTVKWAAAMTDLGDIGLQNRLVVESPGSTWGLAGRLINYTMAPPNRLQALLELSRALSSSLDLDQVLSELVSRISRLTGATGAAVSKWDRERNVLVMLVQHSHHTNSLVSGSDEVSVAGLPATHEVLETQVPRQIRRFNPRDDAAERELLGELGFGAALLLPLVARGQTIGLMQIADVNDRSFSPQDFEFCQAVCDIVATAIYNAMLFEQTRELALRDQLTGLYNRRAFEERLEEERSRAARTGDPLALLVIDLDGLKAINDAGGHLAGDEALRLAAEALRNSIRQSDLPCRPGGDEFAVILPGAGLDAALWVAERARRRLDELSVGRFRFSGGAAVDAGAGISTHDLYRTADDAAYRAKQAGGGRTLAA